jgi:phospholipase D3/4
VESIPEGLVYDADSPSFMSTFDAWNQLISSAKKTLFIGSYYWTLRSGEVANHSSSVYGDKIFNALLAAGTDRKIDIRIAQNIPSQVSPNIDTEILEKRKAAKVRSVNFMKLVGGGVLHTKIWIVDSQHFYVGSANMDWRSLSQVKELGVLVTNCSCLAKDLTKIFNVYWELGRNDSTIPPKWPDKFTTGINVDKPMLVDYNDGDYLFGSFFSSSPPQMNPKGRTNDIAAILHTIQNAERFIHISVMDYFPLELYSPKIKFWPDIDNALRKAAIENKVSVKLLISYWNHSRPSEDYFLRSLMDLSESYKGVDIQVVSLIRLKAFENFFSNNSFSTETFHRSCNRRPKENRICAR